MLLLKIVTHEELQGPAYNFVRISGKRGCPLIRACSVITSDTVITLPLAFMAYLRHTVWGMNLPFFKVTS